MKERIQELESLIESLKANPLAQEKFITQQALLDNVSKQGLSVDDLQNHIKDLLTLLNTYLKENLDLRGSSSFDDFFQKSLKDKEKNIDDLLGVLMLNFQSGFLSDDDKKLLMNNLFDGIYDLGKQNLSEYQKSREHHTSSPYSSYTKDRENLYFKNHTYCFKLLKTLFKDYPEYLTKLFTISEIKKSLEISTNDLIFFLEDGVTMEYPYIMYRWGWKKEREEIKSDFNLCVRSGFGRWVPGNAEEEYAYLKKAESKFLDKFNIFFDLISSAWYLEIDKKIILDEIFSLMSNVYKENVCPPNSKWDLAYISKIKTNYIERLMRELFKDYPEYLEKIWKPIKESRFKMRKITIH